jgi:copper transport protein
VVATGLYSAGREVASLDAAITTPYGRALLAKIALVLGVGFLGLVNSSLLHPKLAAPLARLLRRPPGWTPLRPAQLPRLVLAEASLGLLVLLATGLLTSSSPAHGAQFAPAPIQAGSSVLSERVDDLLVTMEAQPNQPGSNLVTIHVASADNRAPGEILRVIARFTYSNQDIGTVSTDASETAAGVYQVSGSQLSIAGPWQVQVAVRRKGLEDSVTTFDWTVATLPRSVLVSDRPLEPALTFAAVLMLATAAGTGVALWLRSRRARTQSAKQVERAGTQAGYMHR